jgi:hypothetical protein
VARLPHLLALLCGFAVALAVGCGDRSNLIPSSRAAELTQQLADLQASIDAGECDGLSGRVEAFHDDATSLGRGVDKRLRSRINQGATSLRKHAASDCQTAAAAARRQQTETQPTEATPPDTQTDTTPTETSTQTVPTETTPTTTTPTTTEPTVPTTPTTPPTDTGTTPPDDNGGVSPDAAAGGQTP